MAISSRFTRLLSMLSPQFSVWQIQLLAKRVRPQAALNTRHEKVIANGPTSRSSSCHGKCIKFHQAATFPLLLTSADWAGVGSVNWGMYSLGDKTQGRKEEKQLFLYWL